MTKVWFSDVSQFPSFSTVSARRSHSRTAKTSVCCPEFLINPDGYKVAYNVNVPTRRKTVISSPTLELQEVFVLSGIPEYTFVEPVEYTRLLVALRTPGRSIVIEGPSEIGKTTAVSKAITKAGFAERVLSLSARKYDDVAFICDLPNQLPLGTVVIDDFHRLDDNSKKKLADLMKTLADEGAAHSKLVVLGIPNAGQSLISFGKDLANRIEVIPFEANPEYKVEELITKGERAFNLSINIKSEIVNAAQGSFYIAQMLAYDTCIRSNVLTTCSEATATSESYEFVKAKVMESWRARSTIRQLPLQEARNYDAKDAPPIFIYFTGLAKARIGQSMLIAKRIDIQNSEEVSHRW